MEKKEANRIKYLMKKLTMLSYGWYRTIIINGKKYLVSEIEVKRVYEKYYFVIWYYINEITIDYINVSDFDLAKEKLIKLLLLEKEGN